MRAPTPGRGRGRGRVGQSARGGGSSLNRRGTNLLDQEVANMNDNYRRRAGVLPNSFVREAIDPENGNPSPGSPVENEIPAPEQLVDIIQEEVVPTTIEGSNLEAVRTRGINRGTDIPNSTIGKIRPVVHKGCFVHSKVVRDITCIMKDHFTAPYMSWMEVPLELRKAYFGSFKEKYEVPPENEAQFRRVFHDTAMRRYNGMLCEARSCMMQNLRHGRIKNVSEGCPSWMNNLIWDQLLIKWDSPKWLAKSESGRKNRCTEKDGSITKHTGGSISFAAHELKMAKELDRQPTQLEHFERVHCRKVPGKEYVDKKSKRVSAEYLAALFEKYGSQENASNVGYDEDAWNEATGGSIKGRLYGVVGSVESPITIPIRGQFESGNLFNEEQMARILNEKVKEQFDKCMEDYLRRDKSPNNNE